MGADVSVSPAPEVDVRPEGFFRLRRRCIMLKFVLLGWIAAEMSAPIAYTLEDFGTALAGGPAWELTPSASANV